MLDYKNIIIRHYSIGMSGSEIADQMGVSKAGVNKFRRAFKKCNALGYQRQREELMKAVESSARSYEDIMRYIRGDSKK